MCFSLRLSLCLTLTLFVLGILFVDDINPALPPYNLAVGTSFFYGCSDFHSSYILKWLNALPVGPGSFAFH
jgi:hypothetical protein